MKRVSAILMLLLLALPVMARDEHIRPYAEGLAAVDSGDWATVATRMGEAISFKSQEEKSIRIRSGMVPYVPHFWLGIALTNQERWNEALAALTTSERQGVIQQTTYYARLRSTKSQIESRQAAVSSTAGLEDARTVADTALKEAYEAQMNATTAGASRLGEFRQANAKLQEAISARSEGTTEGFRRTAGAATQAVQLFNSAAAKAGKQPSGVVQRRPAQPVNPAPDPSSMQPSYDPPAAAQSKNSKPLDPDPEAYSAPEVPAVPRDSTRVSAAENLPPMPQAALPDRTSSAIDPDRELAAAYRTMASGDLERSDAMLSSLIIANPRWVEALVLRGYARYLEGVLEREDRMIAAAEEDFRAALALNPDIHLDDRSFSPKAIRFFEDLRQR